jgi:DNA polymerase III sliding clamp (beta) subunit (PCNA family)
MDATSEQLLIDGVAETAPRTKEAPHMIARVNAMAIKVVFPFMAQNDVRYYLNGVNIRPLDDGTTMIVATDGHRYVVVHDQHGYAEDEIIVSVKKDALKTCAAKSTFDVMSNGSAMVISGAINPAYLKDALSIGQHFGSIRFFTRDADSPLTFVVGGLGDLEVFGGIMKVRDSFEQLPQWFPRPVPFELAD